MKINYNGYIIEVQNSEFKIIEVLSTGKLKVRRKTNLRTKCTGNNHYGKTFARIESDEQALTIAKNFIDNHIVKWEEKTKK